MVKHEKFFVDALKTGDIQEIRNAIILYVIKDAADVHGELNRALKELDNNDVNIWESHRELEVRKPKTEWDANYIGLLQSDLKYNFSKERLEFLVEVANHVYANDKYVREAKAKVKQLNVSPSEKCVDMIQAYKSPTSKSTTSSSSNLHNPVNSNMIDKKVEHAMASQANNAHFKAKKAEMHKTQASTSRSKGKKNNSNQPSSLGNDTKNESGMIIGVVVLAGLALIGLATLLK